MDSERRAPSGIRRTPERLFAAGLLCLAMSPAPAAAALQLDCPEAVPPQQPFDCRVQVGAAAGGEGRVTVTLPPRLMRVAEPAGWSFDVVSRRWAAALPAWVFSVAWLLAMAALVGAARQRDLRRDAPAPRAWPWALGVALVATSAWPTTAALRITADGETWVSTGFEPRTAIFRESAADDHLRFPRGSRPACWVDPARPERVILRLAPLAALFVAPALLAALGVLGVGLRRVW